ncbi:LOW QUALITY PROTEIN: activating signal cointegrator 1 complex subunit 2-like [Dermacentor silvarum]|uniref:LOW QUALITY PROTEIN: activating signal cointegrator 1 complex subunit 2-like n=1 Tax=Dermacentor silvarum TaxID=543639 RepID=UPI0021013C99|nr:LOW QUALITY PROTEIN: activating signal cointegrator 1 complex subunit 2-like [Dermacentor silvarum]
MGQSKGFVEPVYWLMYRPPRLIFSFDELMSICANEEQDLAEKYSAAIEEWLDRMAYIGEDLTKMLRIPHNRFWSHAMYDNGFHQLLESYLRLAPRYTGLHRYTITKEMQEADERVHKLVFRTYLRLSTNKESKVNFMDKDKFADLIYENFVFDIAKLIDICVLFERGNHDLVCRMVEHIMKCQPKYNSDLKEIENTIFLAFDMAAQSIQSQDDKDSEAKPRRLDEGKAESSELCLMPFQKFLDCITYTVDISASLATFFNVYPTAAKIFTLEKVGPRLARFFDATLPVLKEELVRRNRLQSFEPVFSLIKKRLSYAKVCVLKLFRCLLQQSCLQPLIEIGQEKQKQAGKEIPYIESFFEVICNCLTEKHFIVSYQQRYPLEEDIGMFEQYNFCVDNTRTLYILQSISAIYTELGSAPPSNLLNAQDAAANPRQTPKVPEFQTTNEAVAAAAEPCKAEPAEEELGACGGEPAAVPSSEFQNLAELFPNLSTKFLKECLEYYNNNHDEVVMALLDNNLPPSLSQPTVSTSTPAPLAIESRSIYDNDVFDILRRNDVDMSKLHIGKKSKTPKSLDDKGHDKVLKEVYEKYSIVHDVMDGKGVYEDEYDDTYDSNDVGLQEPAPEGELFTRRAFTTPRVLEQKPGRRHRENRYEDRETDIVSEILFLMRDIQI